MLKNHTIRASVYSYDLFISWDFKGVTSLLSNLTHLVSRHSVVPTTEHRTQSIRTVILLF